MPEERNALAELAEELERFSAENKDLFARRNHLTLHKASSIIAELAKVDTVSDLVGMIGKCRVIAAEEGANTKESRQALAEAIEIKRKEREND